jgi:hypothetical protein
LLREIHQNEFTRAPRAQRYAVQMPLRCRPVGHAQWLTGSTENISRTGVLFRSEQRMDVDTKLEIILDMRHLTMVEGSEIACSGRVVRIVAGDAALQPSSAIAATIEQYDFLRATDLPPP